MSYQSIKRRKAPGFLSLLPLVVLATGCGLTGRNSLVDTDEPKAIIDVIAESELASQPETSQVAKSQADGTAPVLDIAKPAMATGPLAETAADDPSEEGATATSSSRITQRALYRVPDEATIDMPPIPLRLVMPASTRTNLLKKQPLTEEVSTPQLPAPQVPAEIQKVSQTVSALAPPPVAAAVQRQPPAPRTVDKINADRFEQVVLESEIPVLVDFYADWCGPCRQLAPLLDQVAREAEGLRIVKVNSDHNEKLAKKYRVRSLPTAILFINGAPAARYVGRDKIEKALSR